MSSFGCVILWYMNFGEGTVGEMYTCLLANSFGLIQVDEVDGTSYIYIYTVTRSLAYTYIYPCPLTQIRLQALSE